MQHAPVERLLATQARAFALALYEALRGGARLFHPIFVISLLTIALYVPDQSISFSQAISGSLRITKDSSADIGFIAEPAQVLGWWCYSLLVLYVASLFLDSAPTKETGSRWAWRSQILIFCVMTHALLLAPVLVHQQFKVSRLESIIGLTVMTAVQVHQSRNGVTRIWLTALAFLAMCILQAAPPSRYGKNIAVVVFLLTMLAILFWRRWWRKVSAQTKVYVVAFLLILAGASQLGLLIETPYRHLGKEPEFNDPKLWKAMMIVSIWWVLPSLITALATSISPVRHRISVGAALLLAIVWASLPLTLNALNIVCLIAAIILGLARALKGDTMRMARDGITLLFLIGGVWALVRMAPTINYVVAAHPRSQQISEQISEQPSPFSDYYARWLSARGETAKEHGPLILVAAAGGGIRATAHTSMTLAAVDQSTNGSFGRRVFAVSGVSGGALGALVWLAGRADRALEKSFPLHESPGAPRISAALGSFFSCDFMSPVVKTMLVHDLPLSGMPFVSGTSRRDETLLAGWENCWKMVLKGHSIDGGVNYFLKPLDSFSNDPLQFPLTVFNATSAFDGRRAVYSSINADFGGSWRLDSSIKASKAVLDSARFPMISPIGNGCASGDTGAPRREGLDALCREGFYPIPLTDGGYADNSGLATIHDLLDKLQQIDQDLSLVYVIAITSDPIWDLNSDEGTRFDNGRLLSEIFSPAYVLEAARAGHAKVFANIIASRLPKGHFVEWKLSSATTVHYLFEHERFHYEDMLLGFRKKFLPGWLISTQMRENISKSLHPAPLGWTLDRSSAIDILYQATDHFPVDEFPKCNHADSNASSLCMSLAVKNFQE